MKVLMVVSNDVAHDPRVRAEARTLKQAGHDLAIIGWDRRGPGGRTEVDGVPVLLTTAPRRPFDLLRLGPWWRRAARAASALGRFDVVHCHDLDTLPVGARLKAATGARLLYDAHEIWPLMLQAELPRPVVAWWARMEARLGPMTDAAIAAAPAYAAHVERLTKAPVTVVLNAKPTPYRHVDRPPGPFQACAIGLFSPQRMTALLPEACARAGVPLTLAGTGKARYARRVLEAAARHGATHLGLVAHQDVLPLTRASHVVLCPFDPSDAFMRVGMPNKLFEAMSCGRPLVATAGTKLGDLVEREGIGIAAPFNIEGVAAALVALQDEGTWTAMAKRALQRARTTYNWDAQATHLLAVYARLEALRRVASDAPRDVAPRRPG